MTRIIVRVVPDRAHWLPYLQAHIRDLEVCYDERKQAFHTFSKALLMAGDDACVHMEDDAVLCEGFRHKLEALIAAQPGVVQQFFSARKKDLTVGSRWESYFSYNICFYLPPGYSRDLHEFNAGWSRHDEHPTGYDVAMDDWFKARRIKHWINVPSIVDHRVGVSAIDRRRARDRRSKTFEGPA